MGLSKHPSSCQFSPTQKSGMQSSIRAAAGSKQGLVRDVTRLLCNSPSTTGLTLLFLQLPLSIFPSVCVGGQVFLSAVI